MTIKQIPFRDLCARFAPDTRVKLEAIAAREGVEALVLFQNQQFDSSACGDISALAIGPSCTYQTVAELEGNHLGDLPSQRKYPVAYATVETETRQ